MDAARDLREIEAIKQLKARYFRLMDTKQWDAFGELFSEDAEMNVVDDAGRERGHLVGRSEIAARVRAAVDAAQTVHHGHMPEIELTGPDRARGTWAMFDYVEFPSEGERAGFRGYGHYHETYRKVDGDWKIETLKLVRLRRDPL